MMQGINADACGWTTGAYNELVTTFDTSSDNVVALFCMDGPDDASARVAWRSARTDIKRVSELYKLAFEKALPLLTLRTRGIHERTTGPFSIDDDGDEIGLDLPDAVSDAHSQ